LLTAIIILMPNKIELWWTKFKWEVSQAFRWMVPGLGIKRWFALILIGTTIISVGLGIYLLDLFRNATNPWWLNVISLLSLRTISRTWRFVIFGTLGLGMILFGIWGINRSLVIPLLRPGKKLVDQVSDYRRREKGPQVVAIGGGHGISMVLRGLKDYTHNLTAVVSVADDGGSSGELRRTLGILPPGDIRNCLAALSNDEDLLTQLFQYRFSGSEELSGHSFGNLFISAMVDITGSFDDAILESGKVLSVFGKVLPSTLENVHLVADMQLPDIDAEVRVVGESRIPEATGKVRRVWIEPNDAMAFPAAIQSILNADMIIVGPGSIFTSILPNLLVPDLLAAFQSSRALKILVCNIATQKGETDQFNLNDHVKALEDNIGSPSFDLIICNDNYSVPQPEGTEWVVMDEEMVKDQRIYCGDLIDIEFPWRHDSKKLAKILMDLLFEKTGPLI
jgi:uncharacterized cofD-like protein